MVTSLIFTMLQQTGKPVQSAWHDELNRQYEWKHLAIGNKPGLDWSRPGLLRLSLNHVRRDWPYQYQWSGVTKTIKVDITQHPVLLAHVSELSGYAHLDIDVIDVFRGKERILKQIRSSTLQAPGVCWVNLGEHLMSGTGCSLRIRLIVGGPNEGCSATYDWLRLTSEEDANRLKLDPSLPLALQLKATK